MKVKQISVFLENKKGHLLGVLEALAKAKINIRALSIAETSEYGILRMIVPDPDKAQKVLAKGNFAVGENEVIVVGVPDEPGGLAKILRTLNKAGLNVEYVYAFVAKSGHQALVVLRTEDINAGIATLKKAKVTILGSQEVYSL